MSGALSSCFTGRAHFPADQAQREEAQRLLRLQASRICSNPRYPDDLRHAEELIAMVMEIEMEREAPAPVTVPASFERVVLREACAAIDRLAAGGTVGLEASS